MSKEKTSPVAKDAAKKPGVRTQRPWIYAMSVIVLVVVAIAFVAIPPTGLSSGMGFQPAVFGSYKGRDIVFQGDNYFGQQQQLLSEQYRAAGVQDDVSTIYQIWRTAFQRTLFHEAMLEQAESIGYGISPSLLDRALTANPRFLDQDGSFDPSLYRATAASEILHIRTLTRDSLIHERMLEDLRLGSILSDQEKDFIASITNEKRTMDFVYFGSAKYPASEVRRYVEENPGLFRTLDISSITLNDAEEAELLRQRITSAELSFEEAAPQYSVDIYSTENGSRGLVRYFEILRELGNSDLAESIFGLAPNSISEPMSTASGRTVFYRVNSATRPMNLDDTDEFSMAWSYVLTNESTLVQDYMQAAAEEFSLAAQAQGLQGAAEAFGYNVEQTVEFPVNLGSLTIFAPVKRSDGTDLDNAEYSEEFFRTAYGLELGEVSAALELSSGYIVMSLASIGSAQDFELEYIVDTAIPAIIDAWISQDIERTYLNPNNVEDEFDKAFFDYVYAL